jgi:hypothetical protein
MVYSYTQISQYLRCPRSCVTDLLSIFLQKRAWFRIRVTCPAF